MATPVGVGFNTSNQHCGTIENVVCPNCGETVPFLKIKNTTSGSVMLIPVAKTTNATFVVCTSCKSVFEVNKKDFSSISTNRELLHAIEKCENDKIELSNRIKEKYSVGFSTKNQTVAVILAALFTSFGAPFFYIGKPIFGIICFAVSFMSTALQFFPGLIIVVIGGFVLAANIAEGKVTDNKGQYLASKRQQEMFSQGIIPNKNNNIYNEMF